MERPTAKSKHRTIIYRHEGLSIKIVRNDQHFDKGIDESQRIAWLLSDLFQHMAIGNASRVLAEMVTSMIDEEIPRGRDFYEPLPEAEIEFCRAAETMLSHWTKRDQIIDDFAKDAMQSKS